MNLRSQIIAEFRKQFDADPTLVVRAPGRVNVIGEHTDYNDGFVLPIAIDRAIWIALRPRDDGRVVALSLHVGRQAEFVLDRLQKDGESWIEYLKGTAWAMQQAGYALRGWEGAIASDVPIGAGLSSSAALEMATARAFTAIADWPWDPPAMARLGQKAENKWVGMNCGIMDQMISAAGKAGHALLIDCRSLETQAVPLPPETAVVIMDTATRRGLVGSAYNERRAQCEAAAAAFGVAALRDVSVAQFEAKAGMLDDVTRRRARHVVTEDERTLQAAEAMRRGDAAELGRLMDASHVSMRDDFEISTSKMDKMVEIAQRQPGCFGARMTGGGFGGCAVALVRAEVSDSFAAAVAADYQQATHLNPALYICQASEGAEVWAVQA